MVNFYKKGTFLILFVSSLFYSITFNAQEVLLVYDFVEGSEDRTCGEVFVLDFLITPSGNYDVIIHNPNEGSTFVYEGVQESFLLDDSPRGETIYYVEITEFQNSNNVLLQEEVVVPCNDVTLSIVDNIAKDDVEIFPNPANDVITISNKYLDEFEHIELFDLAGNLVMKNVNIPTIDVSNLSSGMYFLKMYDTKSKSITKRILIK